MTDNNTMLRRSLTRRRRGLAIQREAIQREEINGGRRNFGR